MQNIRVSDLLYGKVHEENKILIKLLDNFNIDDFNQLLEYRKYRYDKYQYEYLYESKIEQIEGTANYVELNVLKQLSNELYQEKINNLKKELLNKESFFPIRVLCYDIGALLLTILSTNSINYNDGFNDESFSLSLVKNVSKKEVVKVSYFSDDINKYYNHAKEIINNALNKNDLVVDGMFDILGVNVYNAIYYENYIISIYFLMYGSMEDRKIEYGNFVIESKEYKKLSKVYRF